MAGTTIEGQSVDFIGDIRTQATAALDLCDISKGLKLEWNSQFGGASYLTAAHFTGNNDDLTKTDIENALNVLDAFNTWLDEAGQSRRAYLQKLRT